MAPGAQAAGTGQRPTDRAHRVRSLGRGLVREQRRAISPHRAMARQRLQRRGNPPPLHRSTHGRWSSRSAGSQGLLTPSARLRCCPKIRQARREERSFVHQNERRATRHGGFWGATQRDGALLPRSGVAPRCCTPGALRSTRLGPQQKHLRRSRADGVNRP